MDILQTPPPDTSARLSPGTLSPSQELEAVFIAEMLKAASLGETPGEFGGGAGEEQFASFLRQAQAREMARSGGFGLAHYFETVVNGAKE